MSGPLLWALPLIGAGALAVLIWHLRRPRPRRMSVSFARFVPALPPAPTGRARLALAAPRDPLALLCLLAAALLAGLALLSSQQSYQSSRPDHLGLRLVLDVSHSMSVLSEAEPRLERALGRITEARALLAASPAGSRCAELVTVAGGISAPAAVPQAGPLPPMPLSLAGAGSPASGAPAVLREGGEPARLSAAAALAASPLCPLTHVLVVTDQPPPPGPQPQTGPIIVWDQIGAPVANAGIHSIALVQTVFGQAAPELVIGGSHSPGALPRLVRIEGPGGSEELAVYPLPEAAGRWSARAGYQGPGLYAARLPGGDGYAGDDHARARIGAPGRLAVDWQLPGIPRPAVLGPGGAGDLLVTADPADVTPARPVLLAYPGFAAEGAGQGAGQGTAPRPGQIGPFREDPALLPLLSLDALEAALPAPWPGPLPPGFAPVLTDAGGGVLIARRSGVPGLLLPAPRPDLPEPARSLSLTLFYTGLADLAALPPEPQPLEWLDPAGLAVSEAWRESNTARPSGAPAALGLLAGAGPAPEALPVWPWLLLAALLCLLAERLLRLIRRGELLA